MNNPSKELTPAQASQQILAQVRPLPAVRRALPEAAGCILREHVHAERDNPPFDRVCMDGVAIHSAAWARGQRRFHVQATQAAGAVPLTLSGDDAAIEVMTGAVLPAGTDCVVPLEEYELVGTTLDMKEGAAGEPWRNVQRRGSDCAAGARMLAAGTRLGAAELAVVASAGLASVEVSRPARTVVISTGDELIEPGAQIAAHQVRRSNAYAISAALRLHGHVDVTSEHLRDEEAPMRERLGVHLETCDVLILSGGVSKGKFDFVPSALKALGVQEIFHYVAQRPGRPLWFGTGPRGQLVFGLPGNPVSTLVSVRRYVLPALRIAQGQAAAAPERIAIPEAAGGRKLTFFMPVELVSSAGGASVARLRPPQGSGDFLALAGTDGFVELPPRPEGYPAGFIADFYRW